MASEDTVPSEDSVTTVRILGDEYSIRGASRERIMALAAMVDQRFRELSARQAGGVDPKRLAVLICLNLAEELAEAGERHTGSLRRNTVELGRLRSRLEEVLQTRH